ncbi:spore coat protein CotH [Aquimarina sp. AD1]|uniref:CotH kinase family protein n=1 Tax=Aquimarina sp. (strain AD1) TaxID=1714848 RepID=UPI000E4FDD1B|nr:CotH kinase family protein [Aquimarina sp. AD1]AXT57187.1 spore coat protein CotH [Aquimarina sp. AD1]RKN35826.1 spore coat protein CotH [Aquimarina sp. AD1]
MKIRGLLLYVFLFCSVLHSQNVKTIVPKKESYCVDEKNNIIIWYSSISKYKNEGFTGIKATFNDNLIFSEEVKELSYQRSFEVNRNGNLFKLYFTESPLIQINTSEKIIDDPKRDATFSIVRDSLVKSAIVGIEHRGNISLKFPKKSYDLEFWKDPDIQESEDMQFGNLREDDDWILDGLYNEPLRLRSYFCNKLWLSIHKPYYLDKEPEAKSGIDLMYVEVFVNKAYKGVYALTEQVDRKLLKLKKYKKGSVYGELFKAASYSGGPSYKSAPKYRNIFPHWAGYEMEYPFINYKSHWKNIHKYTKFVIKSKENSFKKKISKKFYLDNAIDYFLFVNLIRATDNLGKNFYVARYTKQTPYFNIPWDLDGVLGVIQDGKRISTTDDVLSNELFDKLLRVNPNNYRQRLKNRWFELRKEALSDQQLSHTLRENYDFFKNNKIYEREVLVWGSDIKLHDHYEYLENWLEKRLVFLDTYFEKLN